jgi:uncharacterized protein (TIGR02001 family)
MKKLVFALLSTGLISGVAIAADAPAAAPASPHTITGNFSIATDYIFRGQSQTKGEAALQGGFDYAHSNGLYLGTWASNVTELSYTGSNMEWDVYGGYTGSMGDIAYNVGMLKYYYPGATATPKPDTLEAYAGVTYKSFGLKASYNLDDYFGVANTDGTVYWDATYSTEIGSGVTLALHYGQTIATGTGDDYSDYKVGVSKTISGFNVGLAYSKATNATPTTVGGHDINQGTTVLTVGKTF